MKQLAQRLPSGHRYRRRPVTELAERTKRTIEGPRGRAAFAAFAAFATQLKITSAAITDGLILPCYFSRKTFYDNG